MKSHFTFFLSFLPVLFCCSRAFGQAPDSTQLSPSLQYALTLYQEAIGDEAHLYNGTQYINYDKRYLVGHQFYRTDELTDGKILYDGTWYTGVPMWYDIVLDKIVLEHPTTEFMFSLIDEKVKTFTLQDHQFIRLEKDSLAETALKAGFYDLLHDGNIQFLAKRTKNIQEQATPSGMEGWFDLATKYYIRKENKYYPVKDKRSVLKVLPDKKKELQRYAREQHLEFRKNREKAILQLIQFYDKTAA
ncbi:hypothetical protein AAE02nite_51110 [Adhaeribacter aerolatus]|uniref:DUF4468 domain-containing protein n=1 Tax=Adhaeribacter aerolatus TaxID=670289 RepID=A0A512B6N8_9BACT|nr:hypothetical protein [Adhaeribacter aerolatus]GEO07447.1 hypothetical protein AAE02nite_51110 [Adhaeribacter aerolatus]